MAGGAGDDTYVVDDAGDVIAESANQGIDTVEVMDGDYTLGANLENATRTGTSWYSMEGNELNNILRDNEGYSGLKGKGGNDTLDGGAGNDMLAGGQGVDTYLFGSGDGADTIADAEANTSEDILKFDLTDAGRIDFNQLWFSREQGTDNQRISVMGTGDEVKVTDWYGASGNHRLNSIVAANGEGVQRTLSMADVDLLVQAMAGMGAPSAGATNWAGAGLSATPQNQMLAVWH